MSATYIEHKQLSLEARDPFPSETALAYNRSMISWRTEADRIECRWSEVGKRVPYNPRWIREPSTDVQSMTAPPVPAFTELSPFGGGNWYARLLR